MLCGSLSSVWYSAHDLLSTLVEQHMSSAVLWPRWSYRDEKSQRARVESIHYIVPCRAELRLFLFPLHPTALTLLRLPRRCGSSGELKRPTTSYIGRVCRGRLTAGIGAIPAPPWKRASASSTTCWQGAACGCPSGSTRPVLPRPTYWRHYSRPFHDPLLESSYAKA